MPLHSQGILHRHQSHQPYLTKHNQSDWEAELSSSFHYGNHDGCDRGKHYYLSIGPCPYEEFFIDLDNVRCLGNWAIVACFGPVTFLEERTNIGLFVVLGNLTTVKRLWPYHFLLEDTIQKHSSLRGLLEYQQVHEMKHCEFSLWRLW